MHESQAAAASDPAIDYASVDSDPIFQRMPDPIPVAGPNGQTLYVAKADFRDVMAHASPLAPARDAEGTVMGYEAEGIGVIPWSTVSTPGFDLQKYKLDLFAQSVPGLREALAKQGLSDSEINDRIAAQYKQLGGR